MRRWRDVHRPWRMDGGGHDGREAQKGLLMKGVSISSSMARCKLEKGPSLRNLSISYSRTHLASRDPHSAPTVSSQITLLVSINAEMKSWKADKPRAVGNRTFSL